MPATPRIRYAPWTPGRTGPGRSSSRRVALERSDPWTGLDEFQHVDLRVNDLEQAREFYSKILPAIGLEKGNKGELYSGFDARGKPPEQAWFGFTEKKDHQANANRIAFWASSREEVDSTGKLVNSAGARNISGPRDCPEYTPTYYAVLFEDPFGNRLEVCFREDQVGLKECRD